MSLSSNMDKVRILFLAVGLLCFMPLVSCTSVGELWVGSGSEISAMVNQNRVFLHKDNAPPHTASITLNTSDELDGLEVLPQFACSPRLTPTDYYLYRSMAQFPLGLNATKPLSVNISDCPDPPCRFVRGKTMSILIEFTVKRDITQMTAKVLALALGVQTNYPLPKPDVCQGLVNAECPLDANEQVTFRLDMPVLTSFPKVNVIVQFYLESEFGIENCMKFFGYVVDG